MIPDLADTERSSTETPESTRIARAAGIISLGNVISRLLGLVREIVKSSLFGAGGAVSAFNVATSVPVMISDLLVNGMVNSSLVPVFSEYAEDRREELSPLFSALLTLVTLILILFTLVAEFMAPGIARLLNTGASGDSLLLTASLLRITLPAVIFLNSAAVFSGLLYAYKRFTLPAFMAAIYNAVIIVVTILFNDRLSISAMAVGLLLGAMIQLLLLLPGLRGLGLGYSFRMWHPGLKKIILLYLPIALGVSVDVLVSRPISYSLASRTGESGISWMNYATYLMQLPQGLVGTAISFAILPTLSRHSVRAKEGGDYGTFSDTLARGLHLAAFLIIPATIGLWLLSTPVIQLIYEHGAFSALDTRMTSLALQLYLAGLPFAAIDLLLVFAFYALQDTLTPSLIGVGSIIFYLAVAITLLPFAGLFSLMIADSLKHILHMVTSFLLLSVKVGDVISRKLAIKLAKVTLASVLMGIVVWWVSSLLSRHEMLSTGLIGEILQVLLPTMAGIAVFIPAAHFLRVEEVPALTRLIREKLGCQSNGASSSPSGTL